MPGLALDGEELRHTVFGHDEDERKQATGGEFGEDCPEEQEFCPRLAPAQQGCFVLFGVDRTKSACRHDGNEGCVGNSQEEGACPEAGDFEEVREAHRDENRWHDHWRHTEWAEHTSEG